MVDFTRPFEKYVIKLVVDRFMFTCSGDSPVKVSMGLRTISPALRFKLRSRGESLNLDPSIIDDKINEIVNEIPNYLGNITGNVQVLHPASEKCGTIIHLEGKKEGFGSQSFTLVLMETSPEVSLFVISSDRNGIHPGDILTPYDASPWGLGQPMRFRVIRNGTRFPDNRKIYTTFDLSLISCEKPGLVLEALDEHFDSTASDGAPVFSGNIMSLWMAPHNKKENHQFEAGISVKDGEIILECRNIRHPSNMNCRCRFDWDSRGLIKM